MSLRSETDNLRAQSSGKMANIFLTLSQEDQEDLMDMIIDEDYHCSTIAKALRGRGYKISDRTVERFRAANLEGQV